MPKIIYKCLICDAKHLTMKEAEDCEAQRNNPKYQSGNKVLYAGAVVMITVISIVPRTHSFIYSWIMLREDNPGKTIFSGGWKSEKEFLPLQPVAAG